MRYVAVNILGAAFAAIHAFILYYEKIEGTIMRK